MPLIDDIVSYWKLDESSGDALDAHGSNDLPELGGTIGAVAGKINGARDFELDDTEGFRVANHADLQGGDTDFTIQAWIKVESVGASGQRRIVAKWDSGGTLEYLLEIVQSTSLLRFFVSNNGSATALVVATNFGAVPLDTWLLVHAWHDSVNNEIGIAVNAGTPNTTSHSTGVFAGASGFNIGNSGTATGSTNGFDGAIDEVGFWRKVLTSQERTDLYNGGNGFAYPFVVTYTITAETGSFALTGQDVALLHHRRIDAEAGAFTLTGQDVALLHARRIAAEHGEFSLTGQDVGLLWHRRIDAETGAFVLTGQDVDIVHIEPPAARPLLFGVSLKPALEFSTALKAAINYSVDLHPPGGEH